MKAGATVAVFFFSILMGITAISLGLGAAFPAINHIAKPFVCPNGDMTVEKQRFNPYPGKVVISETWYCVDQQSKSKERLGLFPMALYAGSIYGLILFLLVLFLMRKSLKQSR